ncbi:MAG: glycosyl transferase family 90 [Chlamydiota bacterium]
MKKPTRFRTILLICLVLSCFSAGYFYQQKRKQQKRDYYKRELIAATHVNLDGEEGYWDIERYLKVCQFHFRRAIKGMREYDGNHFEPSNHRLDCSLIENSFLAKVRNPPKWIVDQVESEFEYYIKRPYGKQALKEMERKLTQKKELLPWLIKYKIYQGKIYLKTYGPHSYFLPWVAAVFYRLCQFGGLPDMEFFTSFSDVLTDCKDIPAPIFAFSKRRDDPFVVAMPDYEMCRTYEAFNQALAEGVQRWPWQQKEERVFWRGGTTGGNYCQPNWKKIPRVRLVELSEEFPNEINARFSSLSTEAKQNAEFVSCCAMHGEFVYPQDAMRYKYLIDVDGTGTTFSRYYWILYSNSVPFKQQTALMQWYYSGLKPYIHYIPVKSDFSDLIDQVMWAERHDDEAKRIAQNSARFAQENLTAENTLVYLYLILQKYATLYSPDL